LTFHELVLLVKLLQLSKDGFLSVLFNPGVNVFEEHDFRDATMSVSRGFGDGYCYRLLGLYFFGHLINV